MSGGENIGYSSNVNLPIAQGTIQNPYRQFTYTIAPGVTETISYVYDYFRILSFSGNDGDMKVRFGGSGSESDLSGAGIGYKLLQPVDRVAIRNASASPFTIVVALAVGGISDDRLNVSGNLNANVVTNSVAPTNAAVSVTTAATLIIAQSTTRKNIVIQNNDATKILYLGGAGVTLANGIAIAPGGLYSNENDGSAYYGIAPSTTIDVRVMSS